MRVCALCPLLWVRWRDVCVCSESVASPPVHLALPTQSTLLRGVVRIENKKSQYLEEDANEAVRTMQYGAPGVGPRVTKPTTMDPTKLKAKADAITYSEPDPNMLILGDVGREDLPMDILIDEAESMQVRPHMARVRCMHTCAGRRRQSSQG